MSYIKPLYKRDDARRLAQTFMSIRREQGENLPHVSTRNMRTVAANLIAAYAAIPPSYRRARIISVRPETVVIKLAGCDGQITA